MAAATAAAWLALPFLSSTTLMWRLASPETTTELLQVVCAWVA